MGKLNYRLTRIASRLVSRGFGVSGRLKPATKERFKTGYFERVECLLKKGGATHGELDQSGREELNFNPICEKIGGRCLFVNFIQSISRFLEKARNVF